MLVTGLTVVTLTFKRPLGVLVKLMGRVIVVALGEDVTIVTVVVLIGVINVEDSSTWRRRRRLR